MSQVVSLSGGRDSTAMLLMMLERGEPIGDIVFFDWGMEFPQLYEHLEKLERYIGRPITRLCAPKSFPYCIFEHVKVKGKKKGEVGYGWPTAKERWCTRIKVQALRRHNKGMVECLGYAYAERFKRATYRDSHRYPLLEWGVTSEEALKYCQAHGFDWGGLYRHFNRVSCWCCPFRRDSEARALASNFPELLNEMREWDRVMNFKLPERYPLSKYLR